MRKKPQVGNLCRLKSRNPEKIWPAYTELPKPDSRGSYSWAYDAPPFIIYNPYVTVLEKKAIKLSGQWVSYCKVLAKGIDDQLTRCWIATWELTACEEPTNP